MIYFILKRTISEESLSYLNNFQILPNCRNAKEFNSFKPFKSNSLGYGCDSVVVSIEACGALGPGPNPGRGPLTMEAY